MAERTYDPYDFETGLKEEFTMTVDQARFGFDAAYNNGQTLIAVLEGTDAEGDEQRLIYPVGPGWDAEDGGKRAIREDGSEGRRFNQNSGVAKLVAAAIGCGAPLRERGTPMEASIWPGLKFRFKRVKFNEGTQYETTRPMPVEFLGVSANGTAGTAAATAPAASTGATANKLGLVKLKTAAKRAESFDQFIEEGLAIADGDAELEALVADERFYAEHHGG